MPNISLRAFRCLAAEQGACGRTISSRCGFEQYVAHIHDAGYDIWAFGPPPTLRLCGAADMLDYIFTAQGQNLFYSRRIALRQAARLLFLGCKFRL